MIPTFLENNKSVGVHTKVIFSYSKSLPQVKQFKEPDLPA